MSGIRRILIATDKFKGSLTAVAVARHLTAGLRRVVPRTEVQSLPVADGGEGTVESAVAAGFARRTVRVSGPLGEPVTAAFALQGSTALIEMAQASGLPQLPQGVLAPLEASTYGTGELIRAALDTGARRLVLGVGGSASTDGGAGMLAALGVRFLDVDGSELTSFGGGALHRMASVDFGGLDRRLATTEVVLASDVDNPLVGPKGAAFVYGPQKGASQTEVVMLDDALAHYAGVLGQALGDRAATTAEAAGAGAAGGIGYGALVGLSAVRRPGIEVLLEVLGFSSALNRAQLLITGEGSLDAQTLHGKAPLGATQAARRAGLDVVAVCGRLMLSPGELGAAGIRRAYPLTAIEPDLARCMAEAGPLVERVGEAIGRDFVLGGERAGP